MGELHPQELIIYLTFIGLFVLWVEIKGKGRD